MRLVVKGRRLFWLGAGVVVSGAVLAGGVAYATVPDAGGVIHGCYGKRDGALRAVDTGAGGACSAAKENVLTWSQTGPPGADGAPGPGATTFQGEVTQTQDYVTLATAPNSGVAVQAFCAVTILGTVVHSMRIITVPAGDLLEAWGTQFSSPPGLQPVLEAGANNNVTVTTTGSVAPMTFNVIARNSTPTPKLSFSRIDVSSVAQADASGLHCTLSGMITPSD